MLEGLDSMSPSILFYRQELNWLGGIGVIVLAVALLPMLGIGGMQLYKAEMAGPLKDERFTPRHRAHGARSLRRLRRADGGLRGGVLARGHERIRRGQPQLLDACYRRLSTHDASLGFFDSVPIESVATVFTMIGAISFNEHFIAWRTLQLARYGKDTQTRAFVMIVLVFIAVTTAVLYATRTYASFAESLRYASFEVVTVISTNGYMIADFSLWPLALPVLLIFSGFIGGCAGSSSGGVKVDPLHRAVQTGRHSHPPPHSSAGDQAHEARRAAVGRLGRRRRRRFLRGLLIVFFIFMALAMMDGMDQVTAFGAVASAINNVGPGLGDVAITFADVSDAGQDHVRRGDAVRPARDLHVSVLLTPAFWRR